MNTIILYINNELYKFKFRELCQTFVSHAEPRCTLRLCVRTNRLQKVELLIMFC